MLSSRKGTIQVPSKQKDDTQSKLSQVSNEDLFDNQATVRKLELKPVLIEDIEV